MSEKKYRQTAEMLQRRKEIAALMRAYRESLASSSWVTNPNFGIDSAQPRYIRVVKSENKLIHGMTLRSLAPMMQTQLNQVLKLHIQRGELENLVCKTADRHFVIIASDDTIAKRLSARIKSSLPVSVNISAGHLVGIGGLSFITLGPIHQPGGGTIYINFTIVSRESLERWKTASGNGASPFFNDAAFSQFPEEFDFGYSLDI